MKRSATLAALGAIVLLAGRPAAAIDSVTGTYEGTMSCRQIAGGAASKSKQDVTVEVVEGKGGFISLDVVGTSITAAPLGGFLAEDAAKSDRGKLTGVQCSLNYSNSIGAAVHVDVVIKPGSESGKLKGTLMHLDETGFVAAICSIRAKRTSTADPGPSPCV